MFTSQRIPLQKSAKSKKFKRKYNKKYTELHRKAK